MNDLTSNILPNQLFNPEVQLTLRKLDVGECQLWDALVKASVEGCFMQSWAWADFKELEGYKTFRYGLFLEQNLVGGCIFYFYPHPSKANLLMAVGGPLLPPSYEREGMQLLVEQATGLAKQLGAIALRIEPLWQQKPDYLAGFVRAPVDLLPCERSSLTCVQPKPND